MQNDKRQSHRVPLLVDVRYWVNAQERAAMYKVMAVNICEDGIFLKTDMPLAIDTEVALEFSLPGSKQAMRLEGRVVWSGSVEMPGRQGVFGKGIWFTECNSECRERLREFVKAETESSAMESFSG